MTKYNWSSVIEWSATAMLIISVALSSWNYYPGNIFTGFIGNIGWMLMGIIWARPSLILISSVLSIIYAFGIFFYLHH